MNDISYNDKYAMTDDKLCALIGNFIKHHRLRKNRSQGDVAKAAGISRSTLSLLERGQSVSLTTLIQILRVLNLLYVLDEFEVSDDISPIAYAKLKKKYKTPQRASMAKEPEVPYEKTNLGW